MRRHVRGGGAVRGRRDAAHVAADVGRLHRGAHEGGLAERGAGEAGRRGEAAVLALARARALRDPRGGDRARGEAPLRGDGRLEGDAGEAGRHGDGDAGARVEELGLREHRHLGEEGVLDRHARRVGGRGGHGHGRLDRRGDERGRLAQHRGHLARVHRDDGAVDRAERRRARGGGGGGLGDGLAGRGRLAGRVVGGGGAGDQVGAGRGRGGRGAVAATEEGRRRILAHGGGRGGGGGGGLAHGAHELGGRREGVV